MGGWLGHLLRCSDGAEGRAAADTSSCLEASSGQTLRTQMVGMAHRKSAHFLRKTAAAEWPVIKSYYWIISDFQESVAMAQAVCNAITIYISFPTIYFQREVRFWKEDRDFSALICILNTANGVSICACEREDFHAGLEAISSIYPLSAKRTIARS